MSHDIPSRARAIIAFLGWRPDMEHESRRWHARSSVHDRCGRSPAARLSTARLGVYFAPKWLRPFYDLTTDEEANDCVCVLAKARDPCR